jgi:1,3-beta-galactosyl-N-acetylhexosamine phosphorylase
MCDIKSSTGRLTIPTDIDIIPQTLEVMKKWGADALRDCDGTEFPQELRDGGAKIYATYYTTRKNNDWAQANPDEIQQCYIMTAFHTATEHRLSIKLLSGISKQMMCINDKDNIHRWWEVIDRTSGEVVSTNNQEFEPSAFASSRHLL